MKSTSAAFASLGALAAVCAVTPSSFAQCSVVDVSMTMAGHLFNRTIDRCADVNGDGVADVAVGDPRAVPPVVRIFSGADGSPLLVVAAPAGVNFFGASVADIGDTNGDGKSELAIGASTSTTSPKGVAFLYSLAAPSAPLLTMTDNGASILLFGRQVAAAGDVDGDGTPDVLVAATHTALDGGEIQIRSGATGATIRTLQSGPPAEAGSHNSDFGIGLTGGVDVTGDGVPDAVVGAPFFKQGGTIFGRIKVYSGATGAVVRTEVGATVGATFGSDVAFVPDLNGDGVADLAIGGATGPGITSSGSGVKIESGATGATLRIHPGITANGKLGSTVRSVGDVDGDGVGDYGATGFAPTTANVASPAIVWSGATGLEIVAIASHIPSLVEPTTEFFSGIAPLGDVDGDGAAEVAVLSQNQPFAPSTSVRLRIMRASAGSLLQASQADGCPVGASTVRPSLSISGCLESGGLIQLDAYSMFQPILFVSATTGAAALPGGCTLTVGLPALIVPLPGSVDDHYGLIAHLPTFSGPVTLHMQAIGLATLPGSTYRATGRSTLTIP